MVLMKVRPQKEGFYSFVRWTFFICRCVGLLPIIGLWSASSAVTRGTLKSWYSIVYMPSIMMQGIGLIFFFIDLFDFNHQVEAVNKFVDFLMIFANYLQLLILMRLSLRWEIMLKEIEDIEKQLPAANYRNIITYTEGLSVTIIILGIVDSFLNYIFTWKVIENCFFNKGELNLQTYLMISFDWFFDYLPFNFVIGSLLAINQFQIYLSHCFGDVIIIIMSIYLHSKFAHFNQLVAQKQNGNSTRNFTSWSGFQVHYTQISRLVAIVDDNINPIVLISFFVNVLLIFQQIFFITNNLLQTSVVIDYTKCLKKSKYTTEAVAYLVYSCSFVLLRTVSVSLFASNLHLESRKPLDALYSVPSSAFNSDMKRLMTQVYYSKNCLTGCRLFNVTRGMILTMLASIVTYELVLFQL